MEEPQELQDLRNCADPKKRAERAGELSVHYQDLVNECSRIRKEALGELLASGMSQPQIAVLLGMTRARVGQLLGVRVEKDERSLLGTGALTIAVAGKSEGMRQNGSTMISYESTRAADLVMDAATSYGLKVKRETVDPPGMVNLSRANLVVIGSPRLLPIVSQVLGSDPNLGFDHGAQGWFLTEQAKDVIHRSPSDRGEPVDFAYIGRLPRPCGHTRDGDTRCRCVSDEPYRRAVRRGQETAVVNPH
jgi:hypothetical protein